MLTKERQRHRHQNFYMFLTKTVKFLNRGKELTINRVLRCRQQKETVRKDST